MTDISDQEVFDRQPGASIDRDNIHFFRGLLQRTLLINRCQDCQAWFQPPGPLCPVCWSDNIRPTEVSGRGTLHSVTFIHGGPTPPGGYPIAVIELEEQQGLRASATIIDCEKDDIRIGMPVELAWTERNGEPLPAFRPKG